MTAAHSTRTRYVQGCRCPSCTAANASYMRAWYAEQRRLARIGKAVERVVNR